MRFSKFRVFRWPKVIAPVAAAAFLVAPLEATPVTVKEIQFLIRQGSSEAEIVREVASRRLLAPLDAATIAALKESGASTGLIKKLNSPEMILNAAEAQAEIRRQNENKARLEASMAEDRALREAKDLQWNQAAERLREAHTVQGWLKEKLFTLERNVMKPVEARSIAGTRIFGFYFASMSSEPCRQFTPQLVQAYQRLKKQYGDDFELIYISKDHDEFNQYEFMRTFRVTCPTMKFGRVDEMVALFGGDRLPWFVLVADTGKPLSINAVNKEYVEPEAILNGLEQLLERTSH